MAWNINDHEYKVFPRNPLLSVSIEFRYYPILKISNGAAIPDFQEAIRSEYPYFRSGKARTISFDPVSNVQTREETLYHFMKNEEGSQTEITLTGSSLLLECRGHISKSKTLSNFNTTLEALLAVCGTVKSQRLGIRYINIVDKDAISDDLEKSLDWADVVNEDFLRMPSNIADLNETMFNTEINAGMDTGALTLRYGMLKDDEAHKVVFRYDLDRFYFGEFDVSESNTMLNNYSIDIYNLFSEMKGNELTNWMETNHG